MQKFLEDSFEGMSKENQETLKNWIKKTFTPRKILNKDMSSYGLKHIFERYDKGFYITNDQFKAAMEECGFKGVSASGSINDNYAFSKKSLIYQNCGYIPHWSKTLDHGSSYTERTFMKVSFCRCPKCKHKQEAFITSGNKNDYTCNHCNYYFKPEESFYELNGKVVPGNCWIEEETESLICPKCNTEISKTPDNTIFCGNNVGKFLCYQCMIVLKE